MNGVVAGHPGVRRAAARNRSRQAVDEARLRFGDAFMDRVTRKSQQAQTRRKVAAPTSKQQPCLDLGP